MFDIIIYANSQTEQFRSMLLHNPYNGKKNKKTDELTPGKYETHKLKHKPDLYHTRLTLTILGLP